MPPKSLKSKLIIAVSALVITSGLLISYLVTHRYSSSLFDTITAQAENLGHAVSLEAADHVLINDLVALQRLLDHQIRSNPSIGYLFISRDDQALAHTFEKGVPIDLLEANNVTSGDGPRFQEIAATSGERYLDFARPILGGKAGVLRLGISEKHYREQITRLWVQMAALTIAILLLALAGTLLFLRRLTNPITALAQATQKIDKGDLGVRVPVKGNDEVAQLSSSFNEMVARMEEYTCRLEEQTMDLERAHHQTRTSCGILREIGSLRTLDEIGRLLLKKSQDILKCDHTVLLIFNSNRDLLFVLSPDEKKDFREQKTIQSAISFLGNQTKVVFINGKKAALKPPLVPEHFQSASRQALIPLHQNNQLFGGFIIGCPGACQCNGEEIELVGLILSQAAGVIKRAVVQEEETLDIKSRIERTSEFCGIIGKDPKMQVIYELIEDIAPTDATVLIQGESGTGKELVARAIHKRSVRKNRPFIVINCSAYPATLLESELFGHEKGAFTGADRRKPGRLELAHRGTLFIDEVGEVPKSIQIKLLRVLQEKEFVRIGGRRPIKSDFRLVAATNRDLEEEVAKGRFRKDLYYRLNVVTLTLPPLRDRGEDIIMLARHFLAYYSGKNNVPELKLTDEDQARLTNHDWPGNVRELKNIMERATILNTIEGLELHLKPESRLFITHPFADTPSLNEIQRRYIRHVLNKTGGKIAGPGGAAELLCMKRTTLYNRMKKLGMA